jgi:hypothetical protein
VRLERFDKIAGYQTAIVPAMIKLDAFAYDYLRPAEDFHESQLWMARLLLLLVV